LADPKYSALFARAMSIYISAKRESFMDIKEKNMGTMKVLPSNYPNGTSSEPIPIMPIEEDPRRDLREAVESVFSDRFMIIMSLLIIPILILPIAFDLSPEVLSFLDICDWVIIAIFVAEYFSKLFLAKNRYTHFKSGWHLLDLLIITLPFVQFAPIFGIGTSGSPSLLLRLLRLPRALAVGGRTFGGRMRAHSMASVEQEMPNEMLIRGVDADFFTVREKLTWEEARTYYLDPKQEWIDISNANEDILLKIGEMLKIPSIHFQSRLMDDGYPRIDYLDRASLVFLQSGQIKYPDVSDRFLTISRTGVLLICSGSGIITVSKRKTDLFEKVLETVQKRQVIGSLVISVLYGVLEQMVIGYRSIVSEIEMEVLRMEGIPRSKLPKDFLEKTFQLNKEVSRLGSNIMHLKEILGTILVKKIQLEGFNESASQSFAVLEGEASYLNETVQHLKENLRSIIDLYINRTSFETNKILKILAVITTLGVIPAIVGGLLGQNLLDVPFSAYLWQIVLLVGIGMAFVFYIFVKLGWLKT